MFRATAGAAHAKGSAGKGGGERALARDLRFGLIEASNNKIGTPVDQILLFCYHFDPHSAKYTPVALGILRVAGAATLFMLGGFVVIMLRRDRRQKGGPSV